jgi:hypothetical protein
MPERERDYRNREITWSEIDKRKNRSRHVSEEPSPFGKNKEKAEWLRKMALKEAHKHFQGKQGTPAHEKAVSFLQENYGTRKFQSLAKQYLDEYDRPKHWGTQFLFLDYDDPELVIDLLNQMTDVYPERSLREQQGFVSKLRTLKIMAEDGEVRDQAAKVLESLSDL